METDHDIPEHRWERPTAAGERLFTFGLEYPLHGLEEIDLYATTAGEAFYRVTQVAAADYEPNFNRIVELEPGGSGGLVQIWSAR